MLLCRSMLVDILQWIGAREDQLKDLNFLVIKGGDKAGINKEKDFKQA